MLQFQSVRRLQGELKSKLLHKHSPLYEKLQNNRNVIISLFPEKKISEQRMDFHVELITKEEYDSLKTEIKEESTLSDILRERLESRAHLLQYTQPVMEINRLGKAIVLSLPLPNIPVYNNLHITIVHSPDGFTEEEVEAVRKVVSI